MAKVVKVDLKSQECFFNLMTGHCIVEGCTSKHTDHNKGKLQLTLKKGTEFQPTIENPAAPQEQQKKTGLKTKSTEFKITESTPASITNNSVQPMMDYNPLKNISGNSNSNMPLGFQDSGFAGHQMNQYGYQMNPQMMY